MDVPAPRPLRHVGAHRARRAPRSGRRKARRDKKDIGAEVEKHREVALRGIDDVVDGARDRLAELDIAIRTQRNRMDRIEGRAEEAREMVKELADEAKQKAQGG